MPKVIWTRPALDDLERLIDFLKTKNPDAARKMALLVRQAGHDLEDMPRLGRPMEDDTGRHEYVRPFGAGAYVLRYVLDGDRPVILRVWHSRENR